MGMKKFEELVRGKFENRVDEVEGTVLDVLPNGMWIDTLKKEKSWETAVFSQIPTAADLTAVIMAKLTGEETAKTEMKALCVIATATATDAIRWHRIACEQYASHAPAKTEASGYTQGKADA